jgi:hypothetical protein
MLEQLASVIAPPPMVESDPEVLDSNARRLRSPLPADFVAYGRAFGRGTFRAGGFDFFIESPFAPEYAQMCDLFRETFAELFFTR